MKRLIIALALLAATPSQALETDLPLWYKEKALLKSYNSLVVRSNLRRLVIVRLCECDPSKKNIALAKTAPVLSEAKTIDEVPDRFRDYEKSVILQEKKIIRDEKRHYSNLLLKCESAKKKSDG